MNINYEKTQKHFQNSQAKPPTIGILRTTDKRQPRCKYVNESTNANMSIIVNTSIIANTLTTANVSIIANMLINACMSININQ